MGILTPKARCADRSKRCGLKFAACLIIWGRAAGTLWLRRIICRSMSRPITSLSYIATPTSMGSIGIEDTAYDRHSSSFMGLARHTRFYIRVHDLARLLWREGR